MPSFSEMDMIEPGLYLGDADHAGDIPTLEKHKISHILTIDNVPLPHHIQNLEHLTLRYIHLQDHPIRDIFSHFDEAFSFIEDGISQGTVLVHCRLGRSRSPTLVIAYIMKKYGMSFQDAFNLVKSKRRCIDPNAGFLKQLKHYEEMGYKCSLIKL